MEQLTGMRFNTMIVDWTAGKNYIPVAELVLVGGEMVSSCVDGDIVRRLEFRDHRIALDIKGVIDLRNYLGEVKDALEAMPEVEMPDESQTANPTE